MEMEMERKRPSSVLISPPRSTMTWDKAEEGAAAASAATAAAAGRRKDPGTQGPSLSVIYVLFMHRPSPARVKWWVVGGEW